MLRTKRVKLTRSICLAGRHVGKGSIHDLAQSLADDLIGQESAVLQNIFCFLARLRFFVNNRRRADEEESRRSRMSTTAKADRFLILNETPVTVAFSRDNAVPEQPKTGIFKRLRGL